MTNTKHYPTHHDHGTVTISRDVFETMSKELERLRPMETGLELAEAERDAYRKRVDDLKKAQRWRKVCEEKPEWGVDVLVIDKDCDIHIVRFSHDFKWISWGKMNTCESDCITHWMPLPKSPEDK